MRRLKVSKTVRYPLSVEPDPRRTLTGVPGTWWSESDHTSGRQVASHWPSEGRSLRTPYVRSRTRVKSSTRPPAMERAIVPATVPALRGLVLYSPRAPRRAPLKWGALMGRRIRYAALRSAKRLDIRWVWSQVRGELSLEWMDHTSGRQAANHWPSKGRSLRTPYIH
ncbi:unnamed protein product, partial [Heterotrigona itama]